MSLGSGVGLGSGLGLWSEVRAVFGFGAGSGEATRLVGVAAHGVPCCLGEVEVVLELGRERSQLLLLHGDACALGLTDAPRLLLESLPQDVRLQTRAQRGAEGETAEGAERGGGGEEREGGREMGGGSAEQESERGRADTGRGSAEALPPIVTGPWDPTTHMQSAVLAGSVISDFGHIPGSPVSSMWSSMCVCVPARRGAAAPRRRSAR